VTYDGKSQSTGLKLYMNGVSAPFDEEFKNDLTETIQTEQPLRLGSRSTESHFKGAVGAFRIYDSEITEGDAARIPQAGLARAAKIEPTPELNDRFENFFDLKYTFGVDDKLRPLEKARQKRADYISAAVPTVMVMEELEEPQPTYLLKRGTYDAPDMSKELWPGVPEFLPPLPEDAPNDRLGLARWLIDPGHPLTARVTVNRYWQMLFGRGIVKTAEDFGVQGSPPSHPKLLDWLAVEFVESGWDLKQLLKTIVMSATYQQESNVTPELLEADPENILLARAPRYRLGAEVIRDNALAVSGLLADEIGGPSVMPYQPEGLWEELAGGAGQGPYELAEGEDRYRRSLYTYRKRTVPHPTLSTFDAPGFDLCLVRRGRTNTPLQALALLNDTTYAEAARHLAERMIREGGETAGNRVSHGFRLATGRNPETRELQILIRGLDQYARNYGANSDNAAQLAAIGQYDAPEDIEASELAAYTALASVILNLDETITRE
jgi:hypothetical protein